MRPRFRVRDVIGRAMTGEEHVHRLAFRADEGRHPVEFRLQFGFDAEIDHVLVLWIESYGGGLSRPGSSHQTNQLLGLREIAAHQPVEEAPGLGAQYALCRLRDLIFEDAAALEPREDQIIVENTHAAPGPRG